MMLAPNFHGRLFSYPYESISPKLAKALDKVFNDPDMNINQVRKCSKACAVLFVWEKNILDAYKTNNDIPYTPLWEFDIDK